MSCLDEELLDELVTLLGDEDVRLIATGFVDQLGDQLGEVEASLGQAAYAEAANVAHKIKGGAGNLGASQLSEIAARIEKLAREGDTAPLASLVEELKSTADITVAELRGRGLLQTES